MTRMLSIPSKILIVLKAIAKLRATKYGYGAIPDTELERATKAFTKNKKGVTRQAWAKSTKGARKEWAEVRKAIEGRPSSYEKTIKALMLSPGLDIDLLNATQHWMESCLALEEELDKAKKEFNELQSSKDQAVQTAINNQYADIQYADRYLSLQKDYDNLKSEQLKDTRTLKQFESQMFKLKEQNESFALKLRSVADFSKTAHKLAAYHLFEPEISTEESLTDQDLTKAYAMSRTSTLEKMIQSITNFSESDLFIIFHSYEVIDFDKFIRKNLPFRLPKNNYVFACHAPDMPKRKSIYDELTSLISEPPTVILVFEKDYDGITRPDFPSSTNNNLARMRAMARQKGTLGAFSDINTEGYEKLFIKRVTYENRSLNS